MKHGTRLSREDSDRLNELILAKKMNSVALAEIFGIRIEAIRRRRAILSGRKYHTDDKGKMPLKTGMCRYGSCQKRGYGKPPYCEEHTPKTKALPPSSIAAPSISALMAGNARVAGRRG